MSATRLAIALGANLPSPAGSPRQTLGAVRPRLEALIGAWAAAGSGDAPACAWSPLLDTAPVGGPANQPGYCNAVVLVSGDLGDPQADRALALLDQLHGLERQFGRDRAREQRWGPRPLDLDLLFWEELRLEHPRPAVAPSPAASAIVCLGTPAGGDGRVCRTRHAGAESAP